MKEDAPNQESEYRRVNVDGTRHLARQSAAAGVRRFVFVSSVKAAAESSSGAPLRPSDSPRPVDPYGRSKLEAECAIREVAEQSRMEAVVVRPPLVYGAGVKANFLRLVRAIDRGFPLPVPGTCNRRSILYLENLASALVTLAHAPAAEDTTTYVTDGPPLSTQDLVDLIASALDRRPRLVRIPGWALRPANRIAGGAIRRLTEDLEVSDAEIRALGWRPPFTTREGIARTVAWYRSTIG